MPWQAVEKDYRFEGPDGEAACSTCSRAAGSCSLYRAFYEPGVAGWPDHGCVGCSFMADHVPDLAHLNARDTTLAYASRAPLAEIQSLQARMGWEHIPWYSFGGDFDVDFGVDQWHGTNAFIRDGDRGLPHLLHERPRRRGGPRPRGATSTSRRSGARRSGRTRRRATRRRRRTTGGSGTTPTTRRTPRSISRRPRGVCSRPASYKI